MGHAINAVSIVCNGIPSTLLCHHSQPSLSPSTRTDLWYARADGAAATLSVNCAHPPSLLLSSHSLIPSASHHRPHLTMSTDGSSSCPPLSTWPASSVRTAAAAIESKAAAGGGGTAAAATAGGAADRAAASNAARKASYSYLLGGGEP